MELKLVVVSGKTNKGAVTLTPPIIIGRSRQAQLTVAHPMISRRHCEIYEVDGLLRIRDLRSLNGTVVDGRRVEESPLVPGKEFSLGPLTFRAEYEGSGDLDARSTTASADEDSTRPKVGPDFDFRGELPPSQGPSSQEPSAPKTEPLPTDSAEYRIWDQTATEAVERTNQDEITLDTDPARPLRDGCDKDTQPSPPKSSESSPPHDGPASPPAEAIGEKLDDFLKGLR